MQSFQRPGRCYQKCGRGWFRARLLPVQDMDLAVLVFQDVYLVHGRRAQLAGEQPRVECALMELVRSAAI